MKPELTVIANAAHARLDQRPFETEPQLLREMPPSAAAQASAK